MARYRAKSREKSRDAVSAGGFVWYFVTIDPNLLVRYANLRREEREALSESAQRHEGVVSLDQARLGEILNQVADDRVAFAERLVGFAGAALASNPGDEDTAQRQALIAAYDAIHHAFRALHVALAGWDPIGHTETLEAMAEVFDDHRDLAGRFDWIKLGRPVQDVAKDLRTKRQAAEWDVYNRDEAGKPRVDFATEAPAAVKIASETLRTVRMALVDHRSGQLDQTAEPSKTP